jgi:Domain of unknown function (DUF4157)
MALKHKTHDIEKAPTAQRAPQPQQEIQQASNEHSRPMNPAVALQRVANSHPSTLKPADVLVLRRPLGNRAVQRIFSNRTQALPPQSSTPANTVQRKTDEEETLQAKLETDRGKENRTGLPDNLKAGIERLSGMAMDDVRVHYNSSQPARLNALAYTQGSDIYIAPGQERHLPHEAWHVVQQGRGRVQPTMQLKDGVSVNDDEGLEHEANVMGAKALTHAGSSPPLNLTQETGGLSGGNSASPPVQRLIGFEVEYQVPTFGPQTEAVTLQGGEQEPSANLKVFVFGGFPYATKLGGSAEAGENSFRLTTDHKGAISREPVRAKLASMGKLEPNNVADRDASSNLEYVTSPVDELAKGSDKVLSDLIDKLSAHATSTFNIAKAHKVGMIPAPAAKAGTGVPVDNFKAWLSDEDFNKLKPTLDSYEENILDSCYIQATIGVIPGAVHVLMGKASEEEGLHTTGGKFTHIYTAVQTASSAVASAVAEHEYIKGLKKSKEFQTLKVVGGMIELLIMYLVGEALSQTSAFPGGSIKNAVPFLLKIDPSKIAGAGTVGMQLFDEVTDDFVTTLAGAISGRPEITVKYWRDLGYAARDRGEDRVTAGSVENLTKTFLQGKKPGGTGVVKPGSELKKLDKVKISDKVLPQNQGQSGVPLEYRYVKARPTATGLKGELLKIVKEARDVNLSQSSEEERVAIEKQVKE